MNKISITSLLLFVLSCILVVYLEYQFQLSQRAYWVYHGLFGFGFTCVIFAISNSLVVSSFLTLFGSFGNELYQDHIDRLQVTPDIGYYIQWAHLGADLVGWTIAFFICSIITRQLRKARAVAL